MDCNGGVRDRMKRITRDDGTNHLTPLITELSLSDDKVRKIFSTLDETALETFFVESYE